MNQADIFQKQIDLHRRSLQAMKPTAVFSRAREKRTIRALEEAQRDVLTSAVTGFNTGSTYIDKNNYASFGRQVTGAYDMYEARSSYGSELIAGLVDMRAAFICGEGVSITSKSPATQKFIDDFVRLNDLNGERLMRFVTTGELEGKDLLELKKTSRKTGIAGASEEFIKVIENMWVRNKYQVERDDADELKAITYKGKDDKEVTVPLDESVYVEIGRRNWNNPNETPSRIHKVLTQIENFSRAAFDLRKNTHLFGKTTPYWKTAQGDTTGAQAINNAIESRSWEIGKSYAGSGDFSLVEPSGGAASAIMQDVTLALKCISTMTGIPVHWMAWPELMSNRATADNLMEVVVGATKKDRLIWEAAIKELVVKAMTMAAETKMLENAALNFDDIDVRLPIVSIALMKQIVEIWLPLLQEGVVSEHDIINELPGSITWEGIQKYKKIERDAKAKESPMQSEVMAAALAEMQKQKTPGENEDEDEDEEKEIQANMPKDQNVNIVVNQAALPEQPRQDIVLNVPEIKLPTQPVTIELNTSSGKEKNVTVKRDKNGNIESYVVKEI